MKTIRVVGAGLAGCEAAFYLANQGYHVKLYEMRPKVKSPAHHSDLFAELVCSNSLKSKELTNACGLLKEEIRLLGSLLMKVADETMVPSGNALSVSRDDFASRITKIIKTHPRIEIIHEAVTSFSKDEYTIIATGPLTLPPLLNAIAAVIGQKKLAFFDASAPIITKDSIDLSKCYYKSRYDRGTADYLNCPFTEAEYLAFYHALVGAEIAPLHDFDQTYFEGCLPLEVMAKRGIDTLRYGPLKPKGLRKEVADKPYAVLQLRQDNLVNTMYSLVGFQTNLTYEAQRRVFRMIPGLEQAEFVRYGLMHRNSYFHLGAAVKENLALKKSPKLYLAGQLSGVEGYVESMASGLITAIYLDARIRRLKNYALPPETMLAKLLAYVTNAKEEAPMNASFQLVNIKKTERLQFALNSLESLKAYWAYDE
ncbi:MAG: methylenetetrahydrofolate--tRNA-(uracil(54)-C(5))-methyltransferase (FADH(2)-oxidizing) TrmFO [Erysipelotrichaceae bacterium]|nr:methylenetetrahydrofolate--tRNA-(uracil(54)-C(5))-methyltransferase (FADH(2)-oxidizing) TrmFO [Erysipelotrichaceae bacterium]